MKIIYIANIRMPTEKAHGIQIMKTCEAFADIGHEVELVVPWRFNFIKNDPFEYYGIKNKFHIKKAPSLDALFLTSRKISFLVQILSFSVSVFFYVFFKKNNIIYSRDELPIFFLSFLKKNIFWETHTGRYNFVVKQLLKRCVGVVAITEGLRNFYIGKGVQRDNILTASDGVDMDEFSVKLSKEECRKRFNLPKEKNIIMYAGHLYNWKGADVLLNAATSLNLKDCLFVFAGGTEVDVNDFKSKVENLKLKNVLILGHKPHQEIPYYLKAVDVLVLPNKSDNEVSAKYTSPMKLFEYMASGTPIVASDLPSVREILNSNNAVLIEANNPRSLACGIETVLRDPVLSDKIQSNAKKDVEGYSWLKRGEKITSFLKNWNQK